MASGKAGRTDYAHWDKVATSLVSDVEKEEQDEIEREEKALGLDGKYARSAAEAEERKKAKEVLKAKKAIDEYKNREQKVKSEFKGLLGPADETTTSEERKSTEPSTVRITRDMVDAGKRVVVISDTSGSSVNDTIVLTQDLSHLESRMAANPAMTPKNYGDDAENDVIEQETAKTRSIFGLVKAFISNVHNCTILVKCKIISGVLEVSHCSNVVIVITKDTTVATAQLDLCDNVILDFKDAPSNKNQAVMPGQTKIYWGDDKDDRIFHAGVKNLHVRLWRDDFLESEITCDYLGDGAEQIGNATPEEFQFVTSVVNGELLTEKVVRAGNTTGKNGRAMTQRELDAEQKMREKAEKMAVAMAEDMIKFKDKDGNACTKTNVAPPPLEPEEDEIEEIYNSMSPEEIKQVVAECEENKTRGNEAFGAGEYGQAILLYSLSLDKADELPDDKENPGKKPLFRRDLCLSNRAACFLKLGQHEKALEDAKRAQELEPTNIKAIFRRGLALHAMAEYEEALPVLAAAHRLEPNNKQIKQALQFAEVRLQQELRKRAEGSNN